MVSDPPGNLALPDKVWRFNWLQPSEAAYFHALLSTPTMRRRMSRLSSGTGGSMKNVSKAKLADMRIPAVALRDQQRFTGSVGVVEARREALARRLSGSNDLFQALQARAFRGEL